MASRRPPPESPRPSTVAPSTPTVSASESPAPATKTTSTTTRKPRAPRAKKVTAPATLALIEISADVRRGMIAEAAYLRAERRGFSGGPDREREDWLLAEAEVDALLKAGHDSSAQ